MPLLQTFCLPHAVTFCAILDLQTAKSASIYTAPSNPSASLFSTRSLFAVFPFCQSSLLKSILPRRCYQTHQNCKLHSRLSILPAVIAFLPTYIQIHHDVSSCLHRSCKSRSYPLQSPSPCIHAIYMLTRGYLYCFPCYPMLVLHRCSSSLRISFLLQRFHRPLLITKGGSTYVPSLPSNL